MRIEWSDYMGQQWSITSKDPVTLGRWFVEMGKYLMCADSRIAGSSRIYIWPQDDADLELIKASGKPIRFTQDDLLEFAQSILDLAAKIGEQEANPAGSSLSGHPMLP